MALPYLDMPGQPRAMEALSQAIQSGDYGHAWAFVGPEGVGQEQAARVFAAYANAPQPITAETVLDEAYVDQFLRGAHPAIPTMVPIKDYRKEDVQAWNDMISYQLISGSVRVVHITKADRLHDAAANAFLKALEEPPTRTIWILDMSDPSAIPDTILSRCRVVPFIPWGEADMVAYVEALAGGLEPADHALIVHVAEGSPVRAARLCLPGALGEYKAARLWLANMIAENPGFALVANHQIDEGAKRRSAGVEDEREVMLEDAEARYGGDLPAGRRKEIQDRYDRLARAERQQTIHDGFDAVYGWIRDVLVVHSLREEGRSDAEIEAMAGVLRNGDIAGQIIQASHGLSTEAALATVEYMARSQTRLELNAAVELTVLASLIQGQTYAFTRTGR